MEKNSFSLLETILAISIIALLVSGFSKFTYNSASHIQEIQNVSNDLYLPNPTISYETSSLNLIQEGPQLSFTSGTAITKRTFTSSTLQMNTYILNTPVIVSTSSKVFE